VHLWLAEQLMAHTPNRPNADVTASPSSAPQAHPSPAQLVKGLQDVIQLLGVAYVELCGHGAAAQAVIADLQRSLTFLRSRYKYWAWY
jgi:hypothetical protein